MEALIRPELGLTFWTILCFVLLVILLSKTVWGPLMRAVDERERALKQDKQAAETARAEAEKARAELDTRLAQMKTEVQARLDEARATADREKDLILDEARKGAAAIVDSSRREIEAQKEAAARDLKNKVAELSVLAAEHIMMKQLDHRANSDLATKYLAELEKERPDLKLGA